MSNNSGDSVKLFKTCAYAVIGISSITAFGGLSRMYDSSISFIPSGSGGMKAELAASISFGVLAALVSIALLALWLMNEDVAQKADLAGSHALLVFLAIALGTAAAGGVNFGLPAISLYTALILSLLICVHHWNNLKMSSGATKGSGDDVNTQVSPSVVAPPV